MTTLLFHALLVSTVLLLGAGTAYRIWRER